MEFMGYTVYGTMDIVLGVTACIISAVLFLYPIPTFWKIVKEKSTGKLIPTHYVAIEMAYMFWQFYFTPYKGTKSPPDFHFMCSSIISTAGLYFYWAYMLIFYKFTTPIKGAFIVLGGLVQVFLILLPVVSYSLYITIISPGRENVLGPVAVFFGVIMYASTLPLVVDAWRHRRFDSWLFGLCTILCCYSSVWFAYGFCYTPTYDVYSAIANGCGIVLTVIQLILCVVPLLMHKDSGTANDLTGDVQNNDIENPLLAQENNCSDPVYGLFRDIVIKNVPHHLLIKN